MKRLVQVGLPDLLPAWELLIYWVVYSTMCVITVGMSAPTGLFVPGMLMVSYTPLSHSALFTVCRVGGLARPIGWSGGLQCLWWLCRPWAVCSSRSVAALVVRRFIEAFVVLQEQRHF